MRPRTPEDSPDAARPHASPFQIDTKVRVKTKFKTKVQDQENELKGR